MNMNRGLPYVRVAGLSREETRSLAATLATAAIVVDANPASGTLLVPRARNRMFRLAEIETVIQEWLDVDKRRSASLAFKPDGTNPGRRRAVLDLSLKALRPLRTPR